MVQAIVAGADVKSLLTDSSDDIPDIETLLKTAMLLRS